MFLEFYHSLSVLAQYKCADENGSCKCIGNVVYGRDGAWTSPMYVQNEIACTNGVFGDIAPGHKKACMCTPGKMCY